MTNLVYPLGAFKLEYPFEDNFSDQHQNFPVFRYDNQGNFHKIGNHKFTWIQRHHGEKPHIVFYDTKDSYTKKNFEFQKKFIEEFYEKENTKALHHHHCLKRDHIFYITHKVEKMALAEDKMESFSLTQLIAFYLNMVKTLKDMTQHNAVLTSWGIYIFYVSDYDVTVPIVGDLSSLCKIGEACRIYKKYKTIWS